MPRKTPTRHTVQGHYRRGKWVESFERGKGAQRTRVGRVVGAKHPLEEVSLESLTYGEIPKITYNLLGKGEKWFLFSGSAAPAKWCYDVEKSLTTTGVPAGISPAKEAVTKKIKDGYVVYYHT